jgi:hypothetical protein
MKTKTIHQQLIDALSDLLSTERCVCVEAELPKGKCSICIYNKLLTKAEEE